jgi:hypothetical protein
LLRIACIFVHPQMTSIWYYLGVLFRFGRTWGPAPTSQIPSFWWSSPLPWPSFQRRSFTILTIT